MKLIKVAFLAVFALAMTLPFGMSKPEYAKKEVMAFAFYYREILAGAWRSRRREV